MRRQLVRQWFLVGAAVGLAAGVILTSQFAPATTRHVPVRIQSSQGRLTIYIRNTATRYITDREIRHDIPAWTIAANRDFAPVWHTQQVRLRLIGARQAPPGATVAVFKQKGPVQGALAFHQVLRGAPAIVVYAGVDDYYGYSNSVSFTHELFELLADPTISQTNQGWPYPYYYLGGQAVPQQAGTVWANEVADPVEKYEYRIRGVRISDFVTPNWFNDHVNGPYDRARVVQEPFQIVRGGYACFWDGAAWSCVKDFRGVGRDAAGFLKAERHTHQGGMR